MRQSRFLFFLFMTLFLVTILVPQFSSAEDPEPKPKKKTELSKKKEKAKLQKAGKKKKTVKKKKPVKSSVARGASVGTRRSDPVVAGEPVAGRGAASAVTEMRYWSNPDYTRIAVSLDRESRFETHQLPPNSTAGHRMYLDITAGKIMAGVKDIQIGDGLLKAARIAQFRPDTVRVVLDLDSIQDYKVFTFSDPFRILIDVKGARREELTRPKETILAALPTVVAEALPNALPAAAIKAENAEKKGTGAVKGSIGKIRRIVVDAGHGGHDPGAIGAGGTREKDIVLQIALKLARKLREELGVDVVLTRSTDVFLELQERTALANQIGADLFVSIHANASLNRNATGIETYYLNLAKTEKAAQLAAKENGTSLEKVSLLQAVLFDLMANYKLNDSAFLAEEVQKAVCRKIGGAYSASKNLGVKQGPFYVLVGATMPSILVETAFLSNEREEGRLKDPQYQEMTAEGICEGIKGYIGAVK